MKMFSFALQTDSFCGNENEACTRGCVRTADVGKRMAAPAAAILVGVGCSHHTATRVRLATLGRR